jgi:hypothetical protein
MRSAAIYFAAKQEKPMNILCCGVCAVLLIGCQSQTRPATIEEQAALQNSQSQLSTARPVFTDKDETVTGTIDAPSDLFGPAIEKAMTRLKITFKERLHTTQLDGKCVVLPAVGPEVFIEYATAGAGKTQLKAYRNPRTTGQPADDVLKQIYTEIAAAARSK